MFTSAKDMLLYALFCAVIPYLLGSLSFSIIVSRLLFHKDVRDYGSHNAGMDECAAHLRQGGRRAHGSGRYRQGRGGRAAGEMVLFRRPQQCRRFGRRRHRRVSGRLFAVIGHVYPLYFGFKGGKAVSVATAPSPRWSL